MFRSIRGKSGHHPDYVFLICISALIIFGLAMLSSASSDLGKIKFDDTYYYLKHQVIYGLIPGIILFFLASYTNYKIWKKLAVPVMATTLLFLVLVFTPLGISSGGATRWINFLGFSFQPSELLKLSFIIYLAAWLSGQKIRQTHFLEGYLPFLAICGLVALLLIIQPSTTIVAILMATGLIIYFASGAKISYVIFTFIIGFLCLAILLYVTVLITPYRLDRVKTYVNNILDFSNSTNTLSRGYHLNQSLMAIGSGGLWGVGYGESTTKFKYLPEPIGDSVFAVIAEELGFIGVTILIIVFLTLFIRGFMIAKNSRDDFAKLVVVGFISVIAVQTFIHMAAVSGLLPYTGIPLPFISYGGTGLVILLTMSGIIVNISKYTS